MVQKLPNRTFDNSSNRIKKAATLASEMINAQDDDERHKICKKSQKFLGDAVYNQDLSNENLKEIEVEHKLMFKGIFHMIIQCEIGETLNDLYKFAWSPINLIGYENLKFEYIKNFALFICKEYQIIDGIFMDKVLSLLRTLLQSTFSYLQSKKWSKNRIELFTNALKHSFFNPNFDNSQIPIDLVFHIADIYVDELTKSGSKHFDTEEFFKMIEPYIRIIMLSKNEYAINYIKKVIFIEIAEHSEREVIQYHPLANIDLNYFISHIEHAAKSKGCSEMSRPVMYSIVKRFETAQLYQENQVDKQDVQNESEILTTDYINNLKNLNDNAPKGKQAPEPLKENGNQSVKKKKLSFSTKNHKFRDNIKIR